VRDPFELSFSSHADFWKKIVEEAVKAVRIAERFKYWSLVMLGDFDAPLPDELLKAFQGDGQ